MVSVDVNHLREAIIVVEKITALSVQNVPYIADFYRVGNVTVHPCVGPNDVARQPDFLTHFVGPAGVIYASAMTILLHIFIHSFGFAVVSSVM